MGDWLNRLPLLCCGGRKQGARCNKQHLSQFTFSHTLDDVRAQHGGAAAAARAAAVYVLLFKIKNHQPAVIMPLADVEPVLFFHKLIQQIWTREAQIPRQYQIIILRRTARIPQKLKYSPLRGRRKGYNKFENSTRVITIKKVDREHSYIEHSCDFAVVYNGNDGQQYIRLNKNVIPNTYTWEFQP